jgi:hypothetical protein
MCVASCTDCGESGASEGNELFAELAGMRESFVNPAWGVLLE